jgi:MYXO-CTERM domain-containing protein
MLILGAGAAIAVGAVCLTCSAFVLLERNIDAAGAWAIVGAFWGLVGLVYFAVASRRRA